MGRLRAAIANPRIAGRPYALTGDAGLVMCTWPKGGKRDDWERHWQFGYFNECMTGFEYEAMSSYGAFIAITGFQYHGPRGHIGFAPRLGANDFRSAFTTARGWGTYQQRAEEETLRCELMLRHGRLTLNSFSVVPPSEQPSPRVTSVLVNGVATNAFAYEEDRLKTTFDRKYELNKGNSVDIEIVY